jgi:predicted RNA-binding Zn-ribbon protein involved in translation (DUF1610 family)
MEQKHKSETHKEIQMENTLYRFSSKCPHCGRVTRRKIAISKSEKDGSPFVKAETYVCRNEECGKRFVVHVKLNPVVTVDRLLVAA